MMSDRGSGPTDTLVPFVQKSNDRSDPNDPLDKAGHLIVDLVRQAAGAAQASHQEAVQTSRKLSDQLRVAEERIRELEVKLRHHEDRADRAEKWLYKISTEIEQRFLGRSDSRPSEPPRPEASFRDQR